LIETNITYNENCFTGLGKLPDNSIDCCVTSPPYFGLRDYGIEKTHWPECSFVIFGFEKTIPEWDGCYGLEPNPEMYVAHTVLIFREVKRVLKDEGTLWLNIGDTYAAYLGQKYGQGQSLSGYRENNGSAPPAKVSPVFSKSKRDTKRYGGGNQPGDGDVKPKDMFGIPWMVAFALRADGWYLRQDIIWHKPNPMPESVSDRCTKSHEYIFMFSKSPKYYFDQAAIATQYKDKTLTTFGTKRTGYGDGSGLIASENCTKNNPTRKPKEWNKGGNQGNGIRIGGGGTGFKGHSGNYDSDGNLIGNGMANKKSVWTVTTKSFKEAHFATFPPDLIIDCIKAGCPAGGIILDPFGGAGTTGIVAEKLDRKYVLFEIKPEYVEIALKRRQKEFGLFV